jgi:hypothetical protein
MGADMEVADPSALADIDFDDGTLGLSSFENIFLIAWASGSHQPS